MPRPGYHACLLVALVGLMWLTGCAGIGDLTSRKDPLLEQLAATLDRDDWRIDPDWSAAGDPQTVRWQLGSRKVREDVQAILAEWNRNESSHGREAPMEALSRWPDRVGRNALILSARSDHPPAGAMVQIAALVTGESSPHSDGLAELLGRLRLETESTKSSPQVPVPTRAAAAETWCKLLAVEKGTLDERFAAPGRAWRRSDLPDAVRVELLLGLSRQLPPERIVGYGNLFASDSSSTWRRAATEGCILFAATHSAQPFDPADWPPAIENAALDHDAAVRRGYGRWLALARHPEAVSRLEAQLHDADPAVAESAAGSLGLVQSDEARDVLRALAKNPSEMLRSAAAGALAKWGPAELKPFLADTSPSVRRAAVGAVAKHPSQEAAVLLDTVIADADLDVQRKAVESTSDWPDELALPVLIDGLKRAAVRTRRECLDELRRRTGFAEPFPVSGNPAERESVLNVLAGKYGWPLDGITRFRLASGAAQVPSSQQSVTPFLARLSDPAVAAAERERLLSLLKHSGPSAAPMIEAYCLNRSGPPIERLLTEVLPGLSPAHAAVAQLGSADVETRRRGAGRLAELGRSASLSPLVQRSVKECLATEQDGLVWRQVVAAVIADGTPEAEQIALLALHSPVPDVRRLGCEYVARHARPYQSEWLRPLLSDPNEAVRLAATAALGRCGETHSAEPSVVAIETLRTMAAGSDRAAQLAALASLASLGDEVGTASLLRRAEYDVTSERVRAIRALAATGRRRFEPDLIRMAGTEHDPLVRRELLSALEAIVPSEAQPVTSSGASGEDRLAAWAARWEGPTGSTTITPPATAAGDRFAVPGIPPEPPNVSGAAR